MSEPDLSWLKQPFVRDVVAALGATNIRFVGGVVRDSLLGLPVRDIDAATTHKPETVMAMLTAANIAVIPTGLDHGTVTAHGQKTGQNIEITTLRVDVASDGRRAKVAFTQDWTGDAARRDFTMNALYVTPSGEVFDPLDGKADLNAGRVRFIGDADKRIHEDALRILRLFRFQAYYGRAPLEKGDLLAAEKNVAMVANLSVERVRDEFMKLLNAPAPGETLRQMVDIGLLKAIVPAKKEAVSALDTLLARDQNWGEGTRSLRRILALLPLSAWQDTAQHFKLSNKQKKHVASVASALGDSRHDNLKIRAYLYGKAATLDAALLCHNETDAAALHAMMAFEIPVFPVTGKDLIARGMIPSEAMGETLKLLEKQWIDSVFLGDKQSLLASL